MADRTFNPLLDILPEPQRRLWDELANLPEAWVLYGGTAIALQLGHRTSVDFDFFSSRSGEVSKLGESLAWISDCQVLAQDRRSVTYLVERGGEVKLSFFEGLKVGRVGEPQNAEGSGISVASLRDLLPHKLKTIFQRGEARDYIDVVALLRSGLPLSIGMSDAMALFGSSFSVAVASKALTYFDDISGGDLIVEADRAFLRESVLNLGPDINVSDLVSTKLSE